MINKNNLLFIPIMVVCGLFSACGDNEMEKDKGSEPLVLTASKEAVIISQCQNSNEALTFKWTSGTNQGTNSSIAYTFEMDIEGNNFAGGLKNELGKTDSRIASFTNKELNDTILRIWPEIELEESTKFEIRIIAETANKSVERQISNVVKVILTPYKKRFLNLYLIGGETPNGLDNQKATPMIPIEDEVGGFYWEGRLSEVANPGERGIKFITELGSWLPSFNQDGSNPEKMVLRTDFSEPDEKFDIPNPGIYRIRLNIETLIIKIECLEAEKTLYLIGGETPNGWDNQRATPMVQKEDDPDGFYWEGELHCIDKGEDRGIKFITRLGSWLPSYNQDGDNPHKMIYRENDNDPDRKFDIPESGTYRIELNTRTLDIDIKFLSQSKPAKNIWMMGSATPGGWAWDKITKMIQNPDNADEYIYNGPLYNGEIKFPLEIKEDFNGKFIVALHPNANITEDTSYQIADRVGEKDVDNKWIIEEAGNYRIVINTVNERISFTKE